MQSQGGRSAAWPGPAACPGQGEGPALGVVPRRPLQAPFPGLLGRKAPGPTGSLWEHESTCDLESEGPAKGITMRTVSRQALFDASRPGEWVSETHRKARWYFQGSRFTVERSPGPLFMSFPESACARAAGAGAREAGRHKINGFRGRGQPPTRPVTILQ